MQSRPDNSPPADALPNAQGSGSVGAFFLKAVACYALLTALWPVVGNGYAWLYRYGTTLAFSSFGPDGKAAFRAPPPKSGQAGRSQKTDVEVKVRNLKTKRYKLMTGSTRYTGYAPMVMCLSLILATPVPWRRRLVSACLGVLLVHLTVLFRWVVLLLEKYSDPSEIQQFTFGPFGQRVIDFLVDPICASVLFLSYLMPAVIWVAVTFRKSDMEWLRGINKGIIP